MNNVKKSYEGYNRLIEKVKSMNKIELDDTNLDYEYQRLVDEACNRSTTIQRRNEIRELLSVIRMEKRYLRSCTVS